METNEVESKTQSLAVPAKPSYRVTRISVSLELADKNYGSGMANYASIEAHVDDASLGQIHDVIEAGLMLYVAAWRTLIAGQLATKLGTMAAKEVRAIMTEINLRLDKVKALLHEVNGD
jgi:hypothetical protein